ncbi:MAG TPA: hypothetical protein VMY42_23770 [Thermoguttaceae bacterium]|nr:hypothetical protein [Thermoguttaceae bacterium]
MTRQTIMPFSACRADARPMPAKAHNDRERVLAFLIDRGPDGATDHEIAEALHILSDSARARRVELRDSRLVVDSGKRRPSPSRHGATVWVVTTAAATRAATTSPAATIGPATEPKPTYFSRNASEALATRPAVTSPAATIGPAPGPAGAVDAADRGPGITTTLKLRRLRSGCCPWCGHSDFWLSIFNRRICRPCHAPVVANLEKRPRAFREK